MFTSDPGRYCHGVTEARGIKQIKYESTPDLGLLRLLKWAMPGMSQVVMFHAFGGRVLYANEQASTKLIVECTAAHRLGKRKVLDEFGWKSEDVDG